MNFRGWEWIIILLLALLLFGGFKKLPDAARGLGRSLRIFKSETKGLVDDDAETPATPANQQAVPAAPQQVAAAPHPSHELASELSTEPAGPTVVGPDQPRATPQAGSNQSA